MDVAIGGETSVTVDNKPLSAAVRGNGAASASRPYHESMTIVDYLMSIFIRLVICMKIVGQ